MAQSKAVVEAYTTPAFRLSYPNIFEPKETLNGDLKYGVTMLFPKSVITAKYAAANHPAVALMPTDDMKGLYQTILKVARANFGAEVDLKTLKLPTFRDGDKPKNNGSLPESDKGMIVMNASSKNKFEAIRGDKSIITDCEELYPGCWCRARLAVAPFFKPNRGVTVYINGLQKVADDTTFAARGRAADMFDEVASSPVNPEMPWAEDSSPI